MDGLNGQGSTKQASAEDRVEETVNPSRSNSDQRQISLCNINVLSVSEVMRIKDMITQHELR